MSGRQTLIDTTVGSLPVTLSQSLIWTGQSLNPESPLYNMGWRFDIMRPIEPSVFVRAFRTVVCASDAMRTVFTDQSGTAGVRILDAPPRQLDVIDLSSDPNPDRAIEALIDARMTQRFDLGAATYDSALIKCSEGHWVWFLNQHHISSDAAASALIFNAVSDAYSALERGEPNSLNLPSFAEHAKRETVAGDSGELETERAYWTEVAANAPPLATPYGGHGLPRLSASTRVSLELDQTWTERLDALIAQPPYRALSSDLARFAILATAYAAFRARVTGETDIVLGVPAHNRTSLDDRRTIGLFIEMLPLAVQVKSEDTFQSLHARTMAATQDWLRHARPGSSSAAAASSFSAVLNYIPARFGDFAGAPVRVDWRHPGAHDAAQDMRLHLFDFEGTGALKAELDLNRDVFRDQTDAAKHLRAMLGAMLDDPSEPVFFVPLCQASELAQISAWETGRETPEPLTVTAAFASQAAATPDAVAVRCADERILYEDLDRAASEFAGALADHGVKPGERVLVTMRRSADLFPVLLGVLRAGAVFVPVPADVPPGRLDQIAALSEPALIVVDDSTRVAAQRLDCARLEAGARGQPLSRDAPGADDPAYMIFTSGSTGVPKGVLVEHGQFARYIDWARRSYTTLGKTDFAVHSSIGFDLTITSLFAPLVSGGAAIVYPETSAIRDLAVLDAIHSDEAHVVKLTPSHLAMVCESAVPVSTIETLIVGGEALPAGLAARALETLSPTLRIFNEYGPTEAVVGCMIHRFDPETDRGGDVPIGRPADDTVIRVTDAGGHRVPADVAGEILIGGTRLARGYFGRDDLTEERFFPDPDEPNRRLYRTGDLARWDETGRLHYLGRADDQIKIGGVRIEPGEIETALQQVDGIDRAVVGAVAPERPPPPANPDRCTRCGLGEDYPGISLDADRVCQLCRGFETYRDKAQAYFDTPDALFDKIEAAAGRASGDFDVAMLVSGGKDSTYALYRLHELTPRILALTLDNGFLSDGAMENIRRICADLGVEHRFMRTNSMNKIFVDSLKRHSNVCNGCFKTIYTLALETAVAEGIPAIVTGLSRGQFFETRLTPELFEGEGCSAAEIDKTVNDARRAYHQTPDAVTQLIDAPSVQSGEALDQVEFIDIYRYLDVSLETLYDFLRQQAPWIRPADTGRSTNCLINDVGIYLHKRREGFHNYALPYSWDVRMGHKTRDEALAELNDDIEPRRVEDILETIGFDEPLSGGPLAPRLTAWVTGEPGLDSDAVREVLAARLPAALVPKEILVLESIPLTPNGKVDMAALPKPAARIEGLRTAYVPPADQIELRLSAIWTEVLGGGRIGAEDNFYDLGGDSIAAIQIAAQAQAAGIAIRATDVFEHQTIRLLARATKAADAPEPVTEEPLLSLSNTDLAALARALRSS
ncbi:MAG: amino acid adenylation domain-containing protein [Pseudomonadota bacterium]